MQPKIFKNHAIDFVTICIMTLLHTNLVQSHDKYRIIIGNIYNAKIKFSKTYKLFMRPNVDIFYNTVQ